jgi:hypothetical protein
MLAVGAMKVMQRRRFVNAEHQDACDTFLSAVESEVIWNDKLITATLL